ncbi:MAG: serine/threonine protein kinase, partial [Acidobacteriales bacterium]|nr:serine/threonine protein kinase [Terriglobales bacterium]
MDSTRWDRVQALFHDAAELPASGQRAFLEAACAGDAALFSDVLAMLHDDSDGSSVIDGGVASLASDLFNEDGPASLPCKDFGPYRAIRVLGEGGMGVVCLAQRKDVGGLVAVKILRDAWLSPARRERFAGEQRLLAQLDHPGIARLYDASTFADGTPYFVMEYVDGLPLTDHCMQHSCSVERRLELFRQVCEAVQYAHSHAVIHRDLKPSNILVKADGSVRLLDFGIAKQLDGLEENSPKTRTGMRLMTPAYAAPEQVRGDQLGVHTDVYSLGVVLYQLITGVLPLDLSGLTPLEAATVIATQVPDPPSACSPLRSVSKAAWADLDVLCLKAMHKDPGRRYRSVEALMRDIDHYLRAEPLEALPDSVRYKLTKFIKRNRRSVVFSVAAVVTVIAMVTFFTLRLARARDAALAQAARTQRIQRFTVNLFEGGDEAAGPSATLDVKSLLDRGVQEAQNLSADPGLQADMFQALGGIYQKQGNLDKADFLLQAALQRRQLLFGPRSPEAAETLVALALLRDAQARYDDAE